MPTLRLSPRDPRTVARDIPGILDALFPQLAPGVVMHLNNTGRSVVSCQPVDEEAIASSRLQNAMLFELSCAAAEQLVRDIGAPVDWQVAVDAAIRRQRCHFDAKRPERIEERDCRTAEKVARNTVEILSTLTPLRNLIISPRVPGLQWISSGVGDFAFGTTLIEVKCTAKRFGASDYRQILMYWLLSYAASIEGQGEEWRTGILMNPRLNLVVEVGFDGLLRTVAAGRTKVDLLELFRWVVGDHSARLVDHV